MALVDARVLATGRTCLVALGWPEALRALRVHLETYCDPQFYTEADARAAEALAGTVRERAEHAKKEKHQAQIIRMNTDEVPVTHS